MPTLINAVIYARESADDSKGTSIPAQIAEAQKYAAREGYEILETFSDESWKGWQMDRPAFTDMLGRAKAGEFRAILVWDYSRFGRDAGETMKIMDELEAYGVLVISVTEGRMEGADGRFLRWIKNVMNEHYGVILGRNVVRGHMEGARNGYAAGGRPPYGYRKAPVVGENGRVRFRFEPNAAEAQIVRRVYEEYAAGKPMHVIAAALNGDGIPSPGGSRWQTGTISRILVAHQKQYLGAQIYNRSKRFKKQHKCQVKPSTEWAIGYDAHPPLVTPELVEGVNARLLAPNATIRGRSSRAAQHMLSGLIRCDLCGSPVIVVQTVSNGVRYSYVTCALRTYLHELKGKPKCPGPRLRMEALERMVSDAVLNEVSHEMTLARMHHAYEQKTAMTLALQKERHASATKALQDLGRQKTNLVDAVSNGMPWTAAKEKLEEIEGNIRARNAELREAAETPIESDADVMEFIRELREHVAEIREDPEAMRAALRALVQEMRLGQETLTITWRFPLDPLVLDLAHCH